MEFEVCVRTCMCAGVSVCDTHKHASFTFDGSFRTFRLDLVTVQAHSLQGFAVLTHCRWKSGRVYYLYSFRCFCFVE